MEYVIGIVIGLFVGGGLVFAYFSTAASSVLKRAKSEGDQIRENAVKDAQLKAKEIELAAQQEQIKRKGEMEKGFEAARHQLNQEDIALGKREDALNRKQEVLNQGKAAG